MQKLAKPDLALVITVFNEADNILPVCQELAHILPSLPSTEIIIIDDGSHDATLERLLEARRTILPHLRIITHPKRAGKSAALRTGISAAHAPWIATMDGDGQDDPGLISSMFALAQRAGERGQLPLVVGIRRKRHDRLSRRLATRFANGLRLYLLRDGCPDTGAPLKLFPRAVFMSLPQFEGLHRFLPALMGSYGAELYCMETRHRPRLHGHSKYTNMNRALVGVRDLLGVMWLQKRTCLPGKSLQDPTEL